MGITQIEEARFGVLDIDECVRFFRDFGLVEIELSSDRAVFKTPAGQILDILPADDSSLPPALEEGPTLREVVWGVEGTDSLDHLVEKLRTDREVVRGDDGTFRTHDETGLPIGLRLTRAEPVDPGKLRGSNTMGSVGRWNEPLVSYERAHPLRICHLAYNIPAAGYEQAVSFYTERLGFRVTDQLLDMGTFMQCEGDDDQHSLLLAHRPDRAGINHLAFEVRNFDEVIEGGNFMVARGWKEARRLGRHTIGSNVFRFFHSPCGGRVEYAADMDRVDDSYGPNIYEERPPHHLWMLTSSREREESS